MMSWEAVLDFWLGETNEDGLCSEAKQKQWWTKDPDFDARIRERFGDLHADVVAGAHEDWRERPKSLVAYVIVLDQFSRNLFRDDPRMYANDIRATEAAEAGIAKGFDRELGAHARMFLYMPFMHCESIEKQDRCVELFEQLADEHEPFAGNVKYAEQHRDIVKRFGRFPHRNDILDRETTTEEEDFLKQPGSSF